MSKATDDLGYYASLVAGLRDNPYLDDYRVRREAADVIQDLLADLIATRAESNVHRLEALRFQRERNDAEDKLASVRRWRANKWAPMELLDAILVEDEEQTDER